MSNPILREQITERIAELSRRIQCIEHEAQARGFTCGGPAEANVLSNPILERSLAPTRHELEKAEATMRRIDRREADCCIHCGRTIEPVRLGSGPYAATCDECVKDFPASYGDEIRFQHQGLRAMLAELQGLIAGVRADLDADQSGEVIICACAAVFENFVRELSQHFAAEERGGYMADALAVAPQLQRKVERLERQHPVLLDQLNRVRASFGTIDSPGDWGIFQLAFQGFATRLIEHETAENAVMQSALLDDIGGG